MTIFEKWSLFLLRFGMGWLFLYAGATKIADPAWTSKGYLMGAKTFGGAYQWLAGSSLLPLVDFLNAWGLTLIGAALIFGAFVRLTSLCGALLMALYYLPVLDFPYPNPHSFIVDEHIIYILAFFVLAAFRAGEAFGLSRHIGARFPHLKALLG